MNWSHIRKWTAVFTRCGVAAETKNKWAKNWHNNKWLQHCLSLLISKIGGITYAYATLQQSVAGNLPFRVLFFCNLGTSKRVLLKFVTTVNIVDPFFPHVILTTPTMFLVDKKASSTQKSSRQKCINSLVPYKLSHDSWLWFFFWALTGPYPMLRFQTRSRQLAMAGRSLDMVKPNPIHGQLLVLV